MDKNKYGWSYFKNYQPRATIKDLMLSSKELTDTMRETVAIQEDILQKLNNQARQFYFGK